MTVRTDTLPAERVAAFGRVADYVALMKPGIILLLIVTEYCAMVLAAGGLPPFVPSVAAVIGLILSSGGANALNMWYDQDIDRVMERTKDRPLPMGRLRPVEALVFGLLLQATSLAVLLVWVNGLAALLSFAGFLYYVLIYTIWLKRRTPQNIVIGGAAGAFPPLVGWAAVTGHLALPALLLFLVIFLWTPPHFWALALYKQEDYRRASIPMLPVVAGPRATKRQMFTYAVLLAAVSVLLYLTGRVGVVYLGLAIGLGLGFILLTLLCLAEREPGVVWAKRTFRYSLLYLSVLFGAMVLNVHR